MSVLEIKNLYYSYEGANKDVLSDINVNFEKGKIYAIVGKSGAGKTTLLSLLSGLTNPTDGTILYNGKNVSRINKSNFRSHMVGVIFQGYNLLPQLTAEENVILSMDVSGKHIKNKKEAAISILEKVELNESKAKRRVLKLSGGEQQRVAIARALSYNPDIILADEPTGNLDGATEDSIMNILTDLAKNHNKCVIIVTHSPKVASFADDKIVIEGGRICQ